MFFSRRNLLFRWLKFNFSPNRTVINFNNSNKTLKMNEAYFKHVEDQGKIAISFRFVQQMDEKNVDRTFNFVRDLDEQINVSMNRIRNNLEKELLRKTKKRPKKGQENEQQPADTVEVSIQDSIDKTNISTTK